VLKDFPLVSIIIPIYNAAQYLNNCLDSVLNQTYNNLEIILVNDGSNDNSIDICYKYSKLDSRVSILSQVNNGVSSARNNGIRFSNGKYIMFVDSDDWINITTISKTVEIAEQKNIDLVFFNFSKEFENKSREFDHIFKNDTLFKGRKLNDLHRRICGPIKSEVRRPQLIDSLVSNWGKLYRASVIKDNKLFFVDTKIIGSEDILFSLQVFGVVKNAYFLNDCLYHYRKDNPNSLTKSNKSSELFNRFEKLYELMADYLKLNNSDSSYFEALNNRIAVSMMNIGLSEVSSKIKLSYLKRIKIISSHLNSDLLRGVYGKFDFTHLELHWKLFYYFCKTKNSVMVYFMLLIMKRFTNK
jgi:glycosyltransferase EpsH